MDENMELWKKVGTTEPRYTKKVTFGRGFTSVDAYSQVMKATEELGVAGKGWGWVLGDPIFPPNDTVVIPVTLWHGDRGTHITQYGQKKLNDNKGNADEDAFKKAATDGLTKCLSYLGFNADVFLGMFDDDKYVQKQEENSKAEMTREEAKEAKTIDDLSTICKKYGKSKEVLQILSERRAELDETNANS